MNCPEIKRIPRWSPLAVQQTCIRNDLYTLGTSDEYSDMLRMVAQCLTPSDFLIYKVAKDIAEHSEGQAVANVMFILANHAVTYTFELNGNDDI